MFTKKKNTLYNACLNKQNKILNFKISFYFLKHLNYIFYNFNNSQINFFVQFFVDQNVLQTR